jgi:hypothetical protein
MSLGTKFKTALTSATTGAAASAFFGIFQGRCTFAAICFSVVGVAGWLHGKDLTSFTAFVVAVQGLLVVHSWKDDVAEQRQVRDGKNPPEEKS